MRPETRTWRRPEGGAGGGDAGRGGTGSGGSGGAGGPGGPGGPAEPGPPAGDPIRVLVVDDSPSVRAVLRRFFSWTDDLRVVGEAGEGAEAVQRAIELAPDVILMDLLMPGMDGYEAIEQIMRRRPTPILVLSAKANRDQVKTAFEAMRRGAVDVLPKPEDTDAWRTMADTLPQMIREIVGSSHPPSGGAASAARGAGEAGRGREAGREAAAASRPTPPGRAAADRASSDRSSTERSGADRAGTDGAASVRPGDREDEVDDGPLRSLRWLAIGASTGGPAAVCDLLAALGPRPPVAALLVQHIAPGFELGLVDWLSNELPLDVRVARHGEAPPPGSVRLAPPGLHLHLGTDGRLELDGETPPWRSHRPSVDELFFSCARNDPGRVAAALLTGMGTDGVQGLVQLQHAGALTYVQDEATSIVFGMPRAALERGAARAALPPDAIGRRIARHWRGRGTGGGPATRRPGR